MTGKWKPLSGNVLCVGRYGQVVAVPHYLTRGPTGRPLEAAPFQK